MNEFLTLYINYWHSLKAFGLMTSVMRLLVPVRTFSLAAGRRPSFDLVVSHVPGLLVYIS